MFETFETSTGTRHLRWKRKHLWDTYETYGTSRFSCAMGKKGDKGDMISRLFELDINWTNRTLRASCQRGRKWADWAVHNVETRHKPAKPARKWPRQHKENRRHDHARGGRAEEHPDGRAVTMIPNEKMP